MKYSVGLDWRHNNNSNSNSNNNSIKESWLNNKCYTNQD